MEEVLWIKRETTILDTDGSLIKGNQRKLKPLVCLVVFG